MTMHSTAAINDLHPAPFEGLDYKTGFDLANEACRLGGDHPTEDDVWHAHAHICGDLPTGLDGSIICPDCTDRSHLEVVR